MREMVVARARPTVCRFDQLVIARMIFQIKLVTQPTVLCAFTVQIGLNTMKHL